MGAEALIILLRLGFVLLKLALGSDDPLTRGAPYLVAGALQ